MRALLRPVCWVRRHLLRLSPAEDFTAYCTRCGKHSLDFFMYHTAEEVERARREARELMRDLGLE